MKFFVITGSPRTKEKSNTAYVLKKFLEGANVETETFDLYGKNIADCIGCYACWKNNLGECAVKDDFGEFLRGIREADAVIWGFPLYYFGMPAKCKAALDRMFCMLYPHMKIDKGRCVQKNHGSLPPFLFVSTCGYPNSVNNCEPLKLQLSYVKELNNCSFFCVPQSGFLRVKEFGKFTEPLFLRLKRAGAEFAANKTLSEKTAAELSSPYIPQNLFLSVHNSWADVLSGEDLSFWYKGN